MNKPNKSSVLKSGLKLTKKEQAQVKHLRKGEFLYVERGDRFFYVEK